MANSTEEIIKIKMTKTKKYLKGEGHSRNGVFFENTPFFRKTSPRYPTAALLYILTSRTGGQAAKYDSKWRRAVLNFGLLWRGISVRSDAL